MTASSETLQLEALLISSSEPVKLNAIEGFLRADLEKAFVELEVFWAGRGMRLERSKGTVSLVPDPECVRHMEERRGDPVKRLTAAALQTLSYIAVNQPVTQKDIESARGVTLSKGLLDSLMDAGYVRVAGRRTNGSGAVSYVTTGDFLEHFGLTALSDLPTAEEIEELTTVPEDDLDGE